MKDKEKEVIDKILFYALLNKRAFLEERGSESEIEEFLNSPFVYSFREFKDEEFGEIFSLPPLKWNTDDLKKGFWISERIGVLLWGIKLIDVVPPFDTPFDLNLIDEKLSHLMSRKTSESFSIRNRRELVKFFELADLFEWRSGMYIMKKENVSPPPPYTYESMFNMIMDKAFKTGIVERNEWGDILVMEKPFAELTEKEFFNVAAIVKERKKAIEFLLEV